jgi:hypothetical protein
MLVEVVAVVAFTDRFSRLCYLSTVEVAYNFREALA